MAARRNANGVVFLAVALALTLGFAASSRGPANRDGGAKLVSIEQLPEIGDMCLWEPVSASSRHDDSTESGNLFTALADETVYAQNVDETSDVLVRRFATYWTPIRSTAPSQLIRA